MNQEQEIEKYLPPEVIAGQAAQKLVDDFLNIRVSDKIVGTPFWMNYDPDQKGTSLYFFVPKGGKMSPEEIQAIISEQLDIELGGLTDLSVKELGERVRSKGVGVDCSGFAYQIARRIHESLGGAKFDEKVIGKEGRVGITKVGADQLTSRLNSIEIRKVGDIKPGDLIRGLDGKHVLIVTARDGNNLRCAHSSDGVPAVGVSTFTIGLTDLEADIFHQEWSEYNIKGVKFNERLLQQKGDRDGVWRLRIVNEQYASFR